MKLFKDKVALSGLIVLLIIVVPSLVFSVYQYSNLSSEEEVIDDVYKNQLDAILFSINQYSTDILTAWVTELNKLYLQESNGNASDIQQFLTKRNQIVHLSLYDSKGLYFSKTNPEIQSNLKKLETEYIQSHPEQLAQLESFLNNNYQKVIGFHLGSNENLSGFLFMLKGEGTQKAISGVLVVNTEEFIREILSPKIQEVAQDKMNILIYHQSPERIIYTNNNGGDTQVQKSKEMWIMPNYYMGIELVGNTLDDLSKKRTRVVLVLVLLFNSLVVSGVFYMYRIIRKEIELAKIKSDFVSNVSHEIRTPLAMISMFTETLKMGRVRTEEKKTEYYNIIFQETNRLTNIVNNILNFSKIENNKRTYQFSKASLNDIINSIIFSYKYDLEQKGFTYQLALDDTLQSIDIDKDAVTDAVINLISNAIKYSDQEKFIKISTGAKGESQFISIQDKGIGIPINQQKYVFDKFFRVSTGDLAYHAQGSGLGLSIVKHIMDAHNGKIALESKPGQGTTFQLEFTTKTKP